VARHVAAVPPNREAGYDHLILIGIGPDQVGFFRFWERELVPALRKEP
jgi:hypothetical protein